ncbi:MAG: outer membrane lipoprotein carrier protein LolA [Bacteroidia bacterium]|nr:outer membrane lipoprotein carrier protein LolA [Bacteroidia bacterium]
MSKLKSIIACLAILSSSLVVSAQNPQEILEESKKKVESVQDLKGRFTYSLSSASLRPVTRKGYIYFKDGKYRVNLGDLKLISDKKTLWQCLPDENEVLVQSVEDSDGPNPQEMFQIYQNQGSTKLIGTKTVNGISCHQLYLSMNSSNLDYNKAYLWIDKKTKLPVKVSLIDRKNTTTTYELFDLQTDNGLQEKLFKFNKEDCPGCDIVDY